MAENAGDDGEEFDYFELTEDEQRALRPARLAKAAAGHLSLRDLTAEVRRLSQPDTVRLTRALKKNANSPAPAVAQGVRSALARLNTDRAATTLHDALHYAVLAACGTSGLDINELAALLAANGPQLGFLANYPLRDSLAAGPREFGVSASIRAAVWSSMICSGHAGAIAALAWLVAESPEFWSDEQRDTVGAVWARVCERLPELPARPKSLETLCEVVTDLERSGEIDSLAAAARTASAGDAGSVDSSPERLAQLAEQVRALQENYGDVRDGALTELSADMTSGRILSSTVVEAVVRIRSEVVITLTAVAAATASPVADTLEQALDDLELAASTHTTADVLDSVGRLAGLHGPEYVANEIRQIADLATTADTSTDPTVLAALDALVTAIDLAGSDPERATDLVRIVQAGLPSAAVLVMLASAPGALTLHSVRPPADGVTPDAIDGDALSVDAKPAPDLNATTDSGYGIPDTVGDERSSAGKSKAKVSAELDSERETESDTAGWTDDIAQARPVISEGEISRKPTDGALVDEPSIDEVLAELDLTVPTGDGTLAPKTPIRGASTGVGSLASKHPVELDDPGLVNTESVCTDDLYVTLMNTRQYALAGWLRESAGAPAVVTFAHRLAAHATAMRTSTGPNAAAFKDLVADLDAEALRDLPGSQMLVYAASVRAGLLSPTAGATGPLRDLCPAIIKSGPAIEKMTDALLTCIYSGAYLTPRSSDVVAEVANLESEYEALVDTARTMLDAASSRNIRYAAATALYKMWMEPTGYLGAALSLVASGSRRPEDLKFVRKRVTELRSRSELESALDRDTVASPHSKRPRRIEARARDKLIAGAGDVAAVLAQWVETTESITQTANTGWMSGQITELRSRVTALRADAIAELTRLAESDQRTRNAAIDAGLVLLEDSLDMLSSGVQLVTEVELTADRVSNGLLALAADLPLDVAPTLVPRRTVTVTDIDAAATALRADTAGWTAAFNRRTERFDHVGTQVIIDMLRGTDPQLARRLSAIRERDVAAAAERLDTRVAELATRIDSDRRFGRLSGDTWSALSVRARAFEIDSSGPRRDFDVMEGELIVVEELREKQVAATIEAKWQQLAELQDKLALTDEQAGRISECIVAEDITTADEYIETIRFLGELPAPRVDVDHLARFFPAFPAMFANATGVRAPSVLGEVKRAIDAGRNPQSGPLADLLAGAQIDLARINRGPTASSRLEQWTNLTGARALDGKLSQVKPVLEQLGFFAAKADTSNRRKGRGPGVSSWMHLTGVRGTEGEALIPAFGSKISPSGDTLRVLAVWGAPTPGRLVELLRDEPTDHAVLVLYFGILSVDARRELATLMRSGPKLPTTAVVDDAAFAYLSAQPTPRRDTTMAITLPFASSAPFTPDVAGLVPVEMFYGRTDELDQVIDMMGSCIVYGGRQLGKSALLRAAARKFDAGENREAIYQSIYKVGQGAIPAEKVWTTLWPRLAEKKIVPSEDLPTGDIAAAAIEHIITWVKAVPGRQLLLLLDESDFFLDADAKEGKFTHVAAFRELMEHTDRAVKVVFAGLHQTARFERLSNHPLAHFGNPVCVGPLPPQQAYDLLTDPLRALGYRFTDDNVAARVLALANNQPSLIQLFGAKLLTHLQRSGSPATLPQRVNADHIEAVWSDASLREAFRKRFDWTLNLDPRYKIIAYTVAYHAYAHGVGSALTPTELRSQCEQWWPQGFAAEDVRTGEFRALLDECVALGVLSYSPAEGAYRLRTPNVLALLGSRDEVDDVLDAAESTPLPDSFDGSLLRPAFAGGITRSPLTSAQIADLLAARSQVRVIAGSDALTVSRCARVLRDENEHAVYGTRSIPIKETTVTNFETACQTAAMTALKGHAVVTVDLRTVGHAAALDAWSRARAAIAGSHGGTLGIVLITGPEQAPLWVRATAEADASSSLTALHRYDNTGLRQWFNEIAVPFQDDASRAELLAVSGGWPMLVNRVAEASSADALDNLRTWLANPVHADEFVDALGVRADDVLGAAWEFLLTALSGDVADAHTLAELMAIAAAEDAFAALRPERLEAAGYESTHAVVDLFRNLGVLVVSADDGQLRLDQVAVAAAETAGSARE